jgi:uncharacterized iron-regulated membrane protein
MDGKRQDDTLARERRSYNPRPRDFGRKALFQIHKIIGLVAGAIFVLVGLSGTVLSYREEADEFLNASLMRVETPAQASPRSLDEILAAAVAAMPPDAKLERLKLPRHPAAATAITYMVETDDFQSSFREMFVDPYTARAKGSRLLLRGDDVFSQPPIQILMAFHWTLLLGPNQGWIIGVVGIVMIASIGVGVYLWLPRNGDWKSGLRVKWGASAGRVVYDLHRGIGAYFAAVLLVILFTGVAMIFKPATRAATAMFSMVRADPDFGKSTPIPGRTPIGVDAAVASAGKVFPDGRLHWVMLPSTPKGVYVVGRQSAHEPSRSKTFRNVSIDQYSGEVLRIEDRKGFTAGERFIEWLFPLHSGEAFGEIGRPFVALFGLIPLALYVTGFLRWRQKRRAWKRSAS